MNYGSLESALKAVFNLDNYEQFLAYNFTYEDFEESFSLPDKSICISYNGVEPNTQMESGLITAVSEPVNVYIKNIGDLDDLRTAAKDLFANTKTENSINNDYLGFTLQGGNLTTQGAEKTILIYELNFGIDNIW